MGSKGVAVHMRSLRGRKPIHSPAAIFVEGTGVAVGVVVVRERESAHIIEKIKLGNVLARVANALTLCPQQDAQHR